MGKKSVSFLLLQGIGLIVIIVLSAPSSGEAGAPMTITPTPGAAATAEYEVITASNAARIVPRDTLGYGQITTLAWSPDGSRLALVTSIGAYVLEPRDLSSEEQFFQINTWEPDAAAAFDDSGTLLAVANGAGRVYVWNIQTGEKIAALAHPRSLAMHVRFEPVAPRIRVSYVRGYLANSEEPRVGTIVWNYETASIVNQSTCCESGIGSFTPTGETLARFSVPDTIPFLDIATGETAVTLTLRDYGEHISFERGGEQGVFNADGTVFAYGRLEKERIWVWDVNTGEELSILEGHTSGIRAMDLDPAGEVLASSSFDGSVRLWNTGTGEQLAEWTDLDRPAHLVFSPDGKTLAAIGRSRILRLIDIDSMMQNGEFVASDRNSRYFPGHNGGVYYVLLDPNGDFVVSQGDSTVRLWRISSGHHEEAAVFEVVDPNRWEIKSIALSDDGRFLVIMSGLREPYMIGDWIYKVRLFDFQETSSFDVYHDYESECVGTLFAYSPQTSSLAVACGPLEIPDILAGEGNHYVWRDGGAIMSSIARSSNSELLAFGRWNDSTISLWDAFAGTKLAEYETDLHSIHSLVFSPDDQQLFYGGAGVIRVIEIASGDDIAWLVEPQSSRFDPHSLSFNSDGSVLAAADYDGIWLGDVEQGVELVVLAGQDAETHYAFHVAFSHDGKLLVSASTGGTVQLWGIPAETE